MEVNLGPVCKTTHENHSPWPALLRDRCSAHRYSCWDEDQQQLLWLRHPGADHTKWWVVVEPIAGMFCRHFFQSCWYWCVCTETGHKTPWESEGDPKWPVLRISLMFALQFGSHNSIGWSLWPIGCQQPGPPSEAWMTGACSWSQKGSRFQQRHLMDAQPVISDREHGLRPLTCWWVPHALFSCTFPVVSGLCMGCNVIYAATCASKTSWEVLWRPACELMSSGSLQCAVHLCGVSLKTERPRCGEACL